MLKIVLLTVFKNYMLTPIYFNCDFLEFTIKNFKNLQITKKYNFTFDLDLDNSSQGFIKIEEIGKTLSYRKVNFKNYEAGLIFSISIDDIAFDIFYIAKGKINQAKIKTQDKIGFYSTFFTLEFLGKLDFKIIDLYNSLFYHKNNKLHRLDICLDLAIEIEKLTNTLFKDVNFYSTLGADEKNNFFAQTYYIKNPMSSQNRFYIFRIYDKLLDTFKKGKNFLFSYLNDFEDVKRLELEIRQDSCKMLLYKIEDILTNKNYCLETIFKGYLEKKGNCNNDFLKKLDYFQNLGFLSSLKKERREFDLKEFFAKNYQIPKNYIAKGHGYINKILSVAGYDGLLQLIFKSLKNQDGILEREKTHIGYELFENLLKYFSKNSGLYNRNTIIKIFSEYSKNSKKPKIKLKK